MHALPTKRNKRARPMRSWEMFMTSSKDLFQNVWRKHNNCLLPCTPEHARLENITDYLKDVFRDVRHGHMNDQLLLLVFFPDILPDIHHLRLLGRETAQTVRRFLCDQHRDLRTTLHFLFKSLQHGDVKLELSHHKFPPRRKGTNSTSLLATIDRSELAQDTTDTRFIHPLNQFIFVLCPQPKSDAPRGRLARVLMPAVFARQHSHLSPQRISPESRGSTGCATDLLGHQLVSLQSRRGKLGAAGDVQASGPISLKEATCHTCNPLAA